MSTEPETITIDHKLSKSFTSSYATGAILNFSDELWQLTFYMDCAYNKSETIQLNDNKIVEGTGSIDTIPFREDQARISLTPATARSLYNLLDQHLNGK